MGVIDGEVGSGVASPATDAPLLRSALPSAFGFFIAALSFRWQSYNPAYIVVDMLDFLRCFAAWLRFHDGEPHRIGVLEDDPFA